MVSDRIVIRCNFKLWHLLVRETQGRRIQRSCHLDKTIRETGVRGAKSGGKTVGHIGACKRSEVCAIKLYVPGIEDGLVGLARKVIVSVSVGAHAIILV